MTSTMAIDLAQRRVNDFRQRCGEDGEAALHLAYHAALPVALNAEFLHLLRINFFLDPPETLPFTAEFEFLLSPLCREIDEGLYEIEPEIRDILLAGLTQTYDPQRIHDIATLLWQYAEYHSPWIDRVELERAQQLTALNFLNPEKAQQWLGTVEAKLNRGDSASREWFVAMRQEVKNQAQLNDDLSQEEFPRLTGSSYYLRKILFLAANPKRTARLRLDQEVRDIAESLQRSKRRDRFELQQQWAVRLRDVLRAMLDLHPGIVHFSGHEEGSELVSEAVRSETMRKPLLEGGSNPEAFQTATRENGLVFEDEEGKPKLVSGEALAEMFDLFSDQVVCVVLNGCYSETQAKAIVQQIPYVIGTSPLIGDPAAIEFAVGFYNALDVGRTIEDAYKFGCAAIQLSGIAEHLMPVLLRKK